MKKNWKENIGLFFTAVVLGFIWWAGFALAVVEGIGGWYCLISFIAFTLEHHYAKNKNRDFELMKNKVAALKILYDELIKKDEQAKGDEK